MVDYPNNKILKCVLSATTGAGHNILSYGWKLNNNIIPDNLTNTFLIDLKTLPLGNHTVSSIATNDCGNFDEISQIFNVVKSNIPIPDVIKMEQTDQISVNKTPAMTYIITLRRKSNVTLTVKDDPSGPNPNAPVTGATVSLNTTPTAISGTTDAAGNVTLQAIPLGTYVVTTTFT